MLFPQLDRWIQKIPVIRKYYTNYYGTIRHSFFRINKKLHLITTPLYVHWLATYDCNFHCKHCEASAGEKTVDVLSTEEISRAVRDMGELGVQTLIITGGEPLLRKDLFQVLHLAKELGIHNTCLATNGYLVDTFREQLAEAGMLRVYISIDGDETTNDTFREVKGAFRKALEALDFFEKIGVKERILNTCIHQKNLHELNELKKIVANCSATSWNIQMAVPVGRAENVPYMYLSPDQLKCLFSFIEETRHVVNVQIAEPPGYLGTWDSILRPQPFFCGAGWETCSIMPDGEVLGCHITYDNRFSEGNIKNRSFKSIWENEFLRFRKPQFDDTCKECKHLHACRGGCWGMRLGQRHCLRETWQHRYL